MSEKQLALQKRVEARRIVNTANTLIDSQEQLLRCYQKGAIPDGLLKRLSKAKVEWRKVVKNHDTPPGSDTS